MAVNKDQCLWIGDQTGPHYVYTCSCARVEGKSYCSEHSSLVYKTGTARRRKRDTQRAAAVWNITDAFNEAVKELELEGYDFAEPQWTAVED